MVTLNINGKVENMDAPADMPLLWALRDVVGLTGTKFGCGMALCGACTVHADGAPIRSCVTPISTVAGKKITTIEGIGATPVGQRVQEAWRVLNVPQCGYCTILSSGRFRLWNSDEARRQHAVGCWDAGDR